jgi:hypothetical protein
MESAGAIFWFRGVLISPGCPVKRSTVATTLGLEGADCASAGRLSLASGSTKRAANATTSGFGAFDGRMVWIRSGCTLLHLREDCLAYL